MDATLLFVQCDFSVGCCFVIRAVNSSVEYRARKCRRDVWISIKIPTENIIVFTRSNRPFAFTHACSFRRANKALHRLDEQRALSALHTAELDVVMDALREQVNFRADVHIYIYTYVHIDLRRIESRKATPPAALVYERWPLSLSLRHEWFLRLNFTQWPCLSPWTKCRAFNLLRLW